jgi:hypothetical protein
MYKKLKRGGLTPGLKNYVKKDNSEEALIKAFKKNSNLAIFVKKSEIMKNPGDYTPVEGNLEKMLKPKNKKTGGISKIDKLRSTKGQFTIEGRLQTLKDKMKKTFGKKSGGLTGGQKKLDKNKDGKITGEDFKMMKQGYGAARKDGMGLQDEKVKPGKVQKVFLGKMIKGAGKSIGRLFGAKKSATATPGTVTMSKSGIGGEGGMLPQLLQKAIDEGKVKKAFLGIMALKKAKDKGAKGAEFLSPLAMLKRISGKKKGGVAKGGGADMGTEMSDKRKKKFKFIMDRLKSPTTINIRKDYEPGTKSPMQRDRKREGYRAKVESLGGKVLFADEMSKGGGADTGRIGEIKSKLALAKDKFKRIEDKKKPQKPFPVPSLYNNNKKPSADRIRKGEPRPKKMGEPIGFKSGTMVKARGCKLGRTRPTKMY